MASNLRTALRLIPRIRHSLTNLPRTSLTSQYIFHRSLATSSPFCESVKKHEQSTELIAKIPLSQIETKMHISFTCKVCSTRNHKQMSKVAYTKGVVIIKCTGCSNNHLIADNLKWFTDLNGKRNIEDILKEKGEHVTKISTAEDGNLEIVNN